LTVPFELATRINPAHPVSKTPNDPEAITAYIRLLGNPYAKSQIIGAEEDPEQAELDLRPPTQAERNYARLMGDPYALLSIAFRDPSESPASLSTEVETRRSRPVSKAEVSKSDFITGCRKIFRPYIPSVERGRLRPHHRDFIIRNQNRSPSERYLLLKALSKYDLTVLRGMETRFNREDGDLTDRKLKQIEQSVVIDDSSK